MKLLSGLLFGAGLMLSFADAKRKDYRSHSVYRLKMEDHQIRSFMEDGSNVDIWKVNGNIVDIRLDPNQKSIFKQVFPDYQVVVEDVQDLIDSEITKPKWSGNMNSFFDTFRDIDEIELYIDQLVQENSNILTKVSVGSTIEKRNIFGVKLSTPGTKKGSVLVGATVHAREWLATSTSLWTLTDFINGYNSGNTRIRNILSGVDWYFVPVFNSDGYVFSFERDRLWRKNRRRNEGSSSYGVDLNRNWGPNNTWCTAGSSKVPSSDTYCGTGPFSEPETTAYSKFMGLIPRIKAVVDIHTYGSLILRPFQYSYSIPPEPYNSIVRQIGDDMEKAVNAVNNARFESIRGVELYPHSGGAIDYTYFTYDIPAFTYELRGNNFIVPDSDIPLSGKETFAGLLVLGDWVLAN